MIILSVDYGDKRTGIAFCDKSETLAFPVCTLNQSYAPELIKEITKIAKEKSAQIIVVGKPVNMDGSFGDRALKCADFAKELEEYSGIKTELFDERMTTVIAHNSLNTTNVSAKKRKSVVDALSAQIILQDYIDFRKNQK